MFPVVERAIDFALDNQHPTGEIEWDADPARVDGKGALLTGSSSIYSSLALRDRGRGAPRPRATRLGAVARIAGHRDRAPPRALPRQGPLGDGLVLPDPRAACCAVTPPQRALASKWDTFVAPGRGVRCVSDQPWVTAAETCELVMALDAIGLHERARTLFEWVQFLRHDDGSYWTGHELRRRAVHTSRASTSPPSSRRGTARPWCSPPTPSAAAARPPGMFRGEGLPGWPHRRRAHRGGHRHRGRQGRTRAAALIEDARQLARPSS